MKIITVPGSLHWCVIAEWFDAERKVFEGDLFACIAFTLI